MSETHKERGSGPRSKRPLKVLILEDRATDAALMLAELQRAGFDAQWQRVDTELAFVEALDAALDVVLADYSMPQFTALRALMIMQERALDVPLVVVTGAIGDEAAAECMRLGAADYVLKDRLARLGPAVQRALEPRQLRAEKQGLTDQLSQRSAELEALHEIGLSAIASLELEAVLEDSLEKIAQAIGAEAAALIVQDDGGDLRQVAAAGDTGPGAEKGAGQSTDCLCNRCIAERAPLLVNDLSRSSSDSSTTCPRSGYRSFAGVPVVKDEIPLGVLAVHGRAPGAFDHATLRLLTDAAALLALAIENSRLHAQTREDLETEVRLNEVARAISAELDLDVILPRVVDLAVELVGADCGAIALVAEDGRQMTYPYLSNMPQQLALCSAAKGTGLAWRVVESGEVLHVADYRAEPDALQEWLEVGIREALGAPIVVGDDRIGALGLFSMSPDTHFSDRDKDLAQSVGRQAGVAIQNARLHASVKMHADELERRVAERTGELARANERLMELDRMKSHFVSDVSHELRTPVSNLALYVGLLQRGKPYKQSHYLKVLAEQADRLAKLVEDILDLSRLDLGRKRVEFEAVDLNSIARQVVAALEAQADASGLDLAFEQTEELPPLRGERNQLAQVVTNLVSNAINYSASGSVTVRTGAENGQVLLQVHDTGMGVDEEDLPHLFERFYRGKRASESEVRGTGLGLAIVKEIVDLHGGDVAVETRVGKGSTFTVRLPACERERPGF